MFEITKIAIKCNSFLHNHGIKLDPELKFFKKRGLIHCQVMDWRGPTEIDGFPVLTINQAMDKLIILSIENHFIIQEKEKREELLKSYPSGYGTYDGRKYFFEETLKIIKEYDVGLFEKQIKIYTKYINQNRKIKFKWKYNDDTLSFETTKVINHFAVNINKNNSTVYVYSQDPCGGRPGDNVYRFLDISSYDGYVKISFTNNGTDRYYMYVYNPKACESTEHYILIGIADKIVWENEIIINNISQIRIRTFCINNDEVTVVEQYNLMP